MELRECPFCGEGVEVNAFISIHLVYQVECSKCEAQGPASMQLHEAEEMWNRRASDRYTVTDAGKAELGGGE